MGMELHFSAIPRKSYFKARQSPVFEMLCHLDGLEIQEGDRFEKFRESLWEELQDYSEYGDPKEMLEQVQFLFEIEAIPSERFSLHRGQYEPLMELFAAAPTTLDKCFSAGEAITGDMEVMWGEDVQLASAGLEELEIGDEWLDAAVSWLRELFSRAAAEDLAIVRSWA